LGVDLVSVVEHRKMCRHFLPSPLAPDVVDGLLALATRAPSAGHTQGGSWLVLSTDDERERFWTATSRRELVPEGILRAPVIVVPLCRRAAYEERYARSDKVAFDWDVPYWMVDAGMATMVLLLATEAAELGALFFRLHRPAALLRTEFAVPDEWEPIGAVALGQKDPAAPIRPARRRRSLEDVVHRGAW
jgi:nitroreductase